MRKTPDTSSPLAARVSRGLVAAAFAATSLFLVPVNASATTTADPSGHRPDPYLLALGDSISFGFQGPKLTNPPDPAAFNTGYVDVLAARHLSLDVANYSCPGETTTTFITGGCPWRQAGFALHDPYGGSQLDAAAAFLRAHRQNAGTVTIAIWGNDILALTVACGGDLACVSQRAAAETAAFAGRLTTILRALRAAAPRADIAVLTAVHAFPPPTPEIDALYDALSSAIAAAAATTTRTRIADVRPLFNPDDPAARTAAICHYTLTCVTNGADSHPSDAGYQAIAEEFDAVTWCSARMPALRTRRRPNAQEPDKAPDQQQDDHRLLLGTAGRQMRARRQILAASAAWPATGLEHALPQRRRMPIETERHYRPKVPLFAQKGRLSEALHTADRDAQDSDAAVGRAFADE